MEGIYGDVGTVDDCFAPTKCFLNLLKSKLFVSNFNFGLESPGVGCRALKNTNAQNLCQKA